MIPYYNDDDKNNSNFKWFQGISTTFLQCTIYPIQTKFKMLERIYFLIIFTDDIYFLSFCYNMTNIQYDMETPFSVRHLYRRSSLFYFTSYARGIFN